MAIDNPPAFLQAGAYSASRDRLNLISARFLPTFANVNDVTARSGFLMGQSGRHASYSMTGWDVTIGRFIGVVENTFASQAGDYQVLNTATQIVTVAAASTTTNRIDIIGVRVQDAFYTGALNQADIVVVQGTPAAGTPAPPALPSSFLPIVQVTVNANTTTGILTDLRKRTSGMGQIYQPYTGQTADVGSVIGECQLLPATAVYPARLRVWDGSTWRGVTPFVFPTPSQSGSGTIAAGNDLILGSLSVPDPGFGYRLLASAAIDWKLGSSNSAALPFTLVVTLDSTSSAPPAANQISRAFMRSAAIGVGVSQGSLVTPVEPSVATSLARTVRAIANNGSGSGFSVTVDAASQLWAFTVEMVPT